MAKLLLLFLVQTLLASLTYATEGHSNQYRDAWTAKTYADDSERCDRMEAKAARLERDVESVDVGANLEGLWVSEEWVRNILKLRNSLANLSFAKA